jgi:exodeoxyribonuclease VII small subunit
MNAPPSVPSSPSPVGPAESALSFEDAIKRLSDIVSSLERGDLPLEDSLRLFEEGVRLSRVSQERLDAAQKKVESLLGIDDQGRARTRAFETTADEP